MQEQETITVVLAEAKFKGVTIRLVRYGEQFYDRQYATEVDEGYGVEVLWACSFDAAMADFGEAVRCEELNI